MTRWIRVQVSIFDHNLFADEPFSEREAWLWLIAKAAWKDTRHRVGSSSVDVPTGSLFVTLREMKATWRWRSDTRVRSFLKMLEAEGMIFVNSNAGKTHVSICNYEEYQNPEREENARITQRKRKDNALKTPVHQYTSISDAKASSCPEPEKSAPVEEISPTVFELQCVSGEMFPVSQADLTEWREAFPAVDIQQQLAAMRSWLNANKTRRKTRNGMKRFIVSWLDRKQNSAPQPSAEHRSASPPRNDLDRMNAALDSLISGAPNEPESPSHRTIDASFKRRDRGSAESVIQFPAISARN